MTVGIVGLGYVGLPLAVAFAEAGDQIVAVDVDAQKVRSIGDGSSYVEDVSDERLRAVKPLLEASTRFDELARAEAILLCVPTPLTPNREPDLTALMAATAAVRDVLRPGQVVVLESTTYPGTTRERLVPILEESGLVAGVDFHVAFSPERIDPGSIGHGLRTTPKLVGGLTEECGARAEAIYQRVCDSVVRVGSPEVAELAKLLENIFRSVNIALVNELSILTERMGVDIWEVVDAAATKPFGFMRFDPGPGMGGHCLPVDPFYLAWKAREYGFTTEFIELAGKVNQQMPYACVERIERALNDVRKPVRGSRVAILGVSYKPGVADTRESPALKIMGLLAERGAQLVYHDAFVDHLPGFGLRSVPLREALEGCDVAVIVTAQEGVDHVAVARDVEVVVDLRGVTREGSPGSANRRIVDQAPEWGRPIEQDVRYGVDVY